MAMTCPYDKGQCTGNGQCFQRIPSVYNEGFEKFVGFCPRAREVGPDGIPVAIGLNTL